jgi:hypothetical protein
MVSGNSSLIVCESTYFYVGLATKVIYANKTVASHRWLTTFWVYILVMVVSTTFEALLGKRSNV